LLKQTEDDDQVLNGVILSVRFIVINMRESHIAQKEEGRLVNIMIVSVFVTRLMILKKTQYV